MTTWSGPSSSVTPARHKQSAVLDSIQRLRRQAQKAGSLKTTEQQRVVVEKDTVVIQPADPQTVYVPIYQPAEVYGEWPYPSHPPVYLPPPPAYYPPAMYLARGSPSRLEQPSWAGCGDGRGRDGTPEV